MNKTELEKKIAEMQEQFDKMQDELNKLKQVKVEESKKWKPEKGQQYFYLDGMDLIHTHVWTDSYGDDLKYLLNNVFRTENDAIESQKKIKFQAQFKNFVEERNEELDWENTNQDKWFMYYSFSYGKIDFNAHFSSKCQGVIYASSEQILRDAIAEIGEESVKKYILEVEE